MIRYLNFKLQEWDENVKRWYDVPTIFSKSDKIDYINKVPPVKPPVKKKLGDCTLREISSYCRNHNCETCEIILACEESFSMLQNIGNLDKEIENE